MQREQRNIYITGGTGYMGSRLIPMLAQRGHHIAALTRKGSESRLPHSIKTTAGEALKMDSYTDSVRGLDTFVHLIGVAHPSPAKAKEFRAVDFVSAQVAVKAAREAGVKHFIYLSVAHPAPMMKEYIAVRTECEEMIRASGMAATFLRPWYVLGPGHRWPYALLPIYWICERIPSTREGARRLGMVTLSQILAALVWAVENPPQDVRILDVPRIKKLENTV